MLRAIFILALGNTPVHHRLSCLGQMREGKQQSFAVKPAANQLAKTVVVVIVVLVFTSGGGTSAL